jgi:hypothetical protein
MEDFKKGISSYITHFNVAMKYGGEEYWILRITYWENVLKDLDVPIFNKARSKVLFL